MATLTEKVYKYAMIPLIAYIGGDLTNSQNNGYIIRNHQVSQDIGMLLFMMLLAVRLLTKQMKLILMKQELGFYKVGKLMNLVV